jgi:hypothetical protein
MVELNVLMLNTLVKWLAIRGAATNKDNGIDSAASNLQGPCPVRSP